MIYLDILKIDKVLHVWDKKSVRAQEVGKHTNVTWNLREIQRPTNELTIVLSYCYYRTFKFTRAPPVSSQSSALRTKFRGVRG